MHGKSLTAFCALLIIASLTACKNYAVSLNDNLVYTPLPLLKNFTISDVHLRECITQTIADKHITKAEELTQLNCSNAGIKNLTGLETFYALEQLNVAENNISSAAPLLHLLRLRVLNIAANNNLACGDVKQLLANFKPEDLNAVLPEHCKTGS
jgi:hypothetical protein